jgi:hypothetical protein
MNDVFNYLGTYTVYGTNKVISTMTYYNDNNIISLYTKCRNMFPIFEFLKEAKKIATMVLFLMMQR